MASSLDFVQYVCQQISSAGEIRYKSMFGEYGIYLNDKFIACVSDNQFLVKITSAGKLLKEEVKVPPYDGASDYYLIDNLEDQELVVKFLCETWELLPFPKPKKKKNT